ncbi:hypothetical protein [Oceanospirillum multiglobuliferum]|uniref:Bacterial Ig domain-containing protein n=1 Tax=Oceanospirillum multiglobuliferum TaxID=64969 RepID=A0A1V4T4A8_9GAMM|nr:hypothetical protein [Oceanospirillum multiglobuliferum]OPX54764.1 hypothetical protein BTE48_12735 [Oceanospirillum multiglobuliferum]
MNRLTTCTLVGLTVLNLAACGNSSSTDADSNSTTDSNIKTATLEGTAATGAAIANETVTAKCVDGSGFLNAVTTGSDGKWVGTVAPTSLPCALKVNSTVLGTMLYSFAETQGTVNISPLTNLAVARATSSLPDEWFKSTNIKIDTTAFNNAVQSLTTSLTTSGFTLPTGNPITTQFVIGDPWDKVLDNLAASINSSTSFKSYSELVTVFLDGTNSFPAFVAAGNNVTPTPVTPTPVIPTPVTPTPVTPTPVIPTPVTPTPVTPTPVTPTPVTPTPVTPTPGSYDLKVTVNVSGTSTVTTLSGVPKPSSQSEFCSADQYSQFQNTSNGGSYTWEIVSCNFSGNEGNIAAKANISVAGFNTSINYLTNYLYIAK